MLGIKEKVRSISPYKKTNVKKDVRHLYHIQRRPSLIIIRAQVMSWPQARHLISTVFSPKLSSALRRSVILIVSNRSLSTSSSAAKYRSQGILAFPFPFLFTAVFVLLSSIVPALISALYVSSSTLSNIHFS
jgi:hypothetical protein